jgi:C-terminal processing protease CtpA/Prc
VFRQCSDAIDANNSVIIPQVVNWYSERGVSILGVGVDSTIAIKPPRQPKSDVARKLAWIKAQVVPTIRKLAELGYAEELMEVIAEAISAARNET